MASTATLLAMANHNLSSNRYSRNNLDRVLFATLAIFSRIANVDRSSRPVESRKSVVQVRCCIRAVLYIYINRVQYHIQPPDISSTVNRPTTNVMEIWHPPQTEHIVISRDADPPSSSPANCNTSQQRYPLSNRQPPDHLQL